MSRSVVPQPSASDLAAYRGARDSCGRRRPALSAAFASVVCLAGGCGSKHGQLIAFLRAHDVPAATGHYTVYPPDQLTVHAPTTPEIDGASQTVRPDGKIVLRLLGEVDVAGLTTAEIAEKLEAQLARYYQDPEVMLEVSRFRSQRYFVFGHVTIPGAKPYTGRDTLLAALADAQPTFLAWRSRIRVVRPPAQDGGEPKVITIDLDKMVHDGDAAQNVLLQAGDVIEVPPTPLAWLGLRVRELLYPVEPALRTYIGPSDTIRATREYRESDEVGEESD